MYKTYLFHVMNCFPSAKQYVLMKLYCTMVFLKPKQINLKNKNVLARILTLKKNTVKEKDIMNG